MNPLGETINPLSRRAPIREHEGEPVPGLPEALPAGETLLWQGAPATATLARRAFHLRGIAIYFAILGGWRAASMIADGAALPEIAGGVLLILLLGLAPLVILGVIARITARTTMYTLTDRRLVLRIGIALPMTLNIPFDVVADATARIESDGTGDVTLALLPPHRISWIVLWPHARPWRVSRPEPMLRSIPDAARVASLLSRALAAHAEQAVPALRPAAAVASGRPEAVAA